MLSQALNISVHSAKINATFRQPRRESAVSMCHLKRPPWENYGIIFSMQ